MAMHMNFPGRLSPSLCISRSNLLALHAVECIDVCMHIIVITMHKSIYALSMGALCIDAFCSWVHSWVHYAWMHIVHVSPYRIVLMVSV